MMFLRSLFYLILLFMYQLILSTQIRIFSKSFKNITTIYCQLETGHVTITACADKYGLPSAFLRQEIELNAE